MMARGLHVCGDEPSTTQYYLNGGIYLPLTPNPRL